MNMQDRMNQLSNVSSPQSTSVLEQKEFTPLTYYKHIEEQQIFIDTLDALINTINEFSIRTLVIQDNRLNEITYLSNKRIDKQVNLSLEKIYLDLEKLLTDRSGYYKFQYGRDIVIEYYYAPIVKCPLISITNNRTESYNFDAFQTITQDMEDGKNIILCGNIDFSAIAGLLEKHLGTKKLVVVNSNLITSNSVLHFNPQFYQETQVYQTIYGRADNEFIVINNPHDIKGFVRLCNNKGRILAFLPEITGQEIISVLSPHLNTDYLKACFTEKLGGLYVFRKNGLELRCTKHKLATPVSMTGKELISAKLKINNPDKDKLYLI